MDVGLLVLTPMAALVTGVVLQLIFAAVLSTRAKGWLAFATGLAALAGAGMARSNWLITWMASACSSP